MDSDDCPGEKILFEIIKLTIHFYLIGHQIPNHELINL